MMPDEKIEPEAHGARAGRLLTRGGSAFIIISAVKACGLFNGWWP